MSPRGGIRVSKLKGGTGESSTVGKRDRPSFPQPSDLPPSLCGCLPDPEKSGSFLLLLKVLHSIPGQKMLANSRSLPPLLVPQNPTSQFDPPAETPFSLLLLSTPVSILWLYLLWVTTSNRFVEILREDKHSEALTALMAIFTPTKSSWPSDILDATRRASSVRMIRKVFLSPTLRGPGSHFNFRFAKGEIRLRFSDAFEHVLNGDLELQPTASVDLVKAMLLERDGVEVDGWKIKVVVEWKWAWRVSLWIIRGLGSRLANLSDLWNDDDQDLLGTVFSPVPLALLSFNPNSSRENPFLPPCLYPRFTAHVSTRPVRSTVV